MRDLDDLMLRVAGPKKGGMSYSREREGRALESKGNKKAKQLGFIAKECESGSDSKQVLEIAELTVLSHIGHSAFEPGLGFIDEGFLSR